MSQRNPLNERYQGEGPSGKTKKSAAKLKPKAAAAASVRVEAAPTNKQERKAARRRREDQERKRAEEHAKKVAEREREAKAAAGEDAAEATEKKPGLLASLLPSKPAASASANASQSKPAPRNSAYPDTPEYKHWRRIYWVLIGIGIVIIAVTFMVQTQFTEAASLWGMLMVAAYAFVIGAIVLDFVKIRPLVKAHQAAKGGLAGKKSPKQLKHEQEAAERARELEQYKKARKAAGKLARPAFLGGKPKEGASIVIDLEPDEGKNTVE